MNGPRVVVVVVSWNTRELLAECLRSLEPDVESGLAAVCVVDNESSDGSAELVEAEFEWATLVRTGSNAGFGPAVNLGVAEMPKADWVAPANADLRFDRGSIARLVDRGEATGDIGAVAPRLVMPSGETQHSVHSFPSPLLGVVNNLGVAGLVPGLGDRLCLETYWDESKARDVSWAHGAFLVVREAAFTQIGGFDPTQWMYAEDIDLGWRLREGGWKTAYEPAAVVHHEVSAAASQAWGEERMERHVMATKDWMVRRQGRARARVYSALNAAGSGFRLACYAVLAVVRPARFGWRRDLHRRYARIHLMALRSID